MSVEQLQQRYGFGDDLPAKNLKIRATGTELCLCLLLRLCLCACACVRCVHVKCVDPVLHNASCPDKYQKG